MQVQPSESEPSFDKLYEKIYSELRSVAHFHRLNERRDLTLQTTALVHEAYLRLAESGTTIKPEDQRHLKALTSRVIRRVLVDYARSKNAVKRDDSRAEMDMACRDPLLDPALEVDVLDLDSALKQLASLSSRLAQTVEYRFFGGMSAEEIAEEMNISSRTVERDWKKARIFLLELLSEKREPDRSA